jgi:hypothetical protein
METVRAAYRVDQSGKRVSLRSIGAAVTGGTIRAYRAAIVLGLGLAGAATVEAQHTLGFEFQVNSATVNAQQSPAVGTRSDGAFVVVWSSYDVLYGGSFDIRGRQFDSSGQPQATEFRVNSFTSDSQSRPAIAVEPDGDFVVVWDSYRQDGSGYHAFGVFGRRFTSAGTPLASEFAVNVATPVRISTTT